MSNYLELPFCQTDFHCKHSHLSPSSPMYSASPEICQQQTMQANHVARPILRFALTYPKISKVVMKYVNLEYWRSSKGGVETDGWSHLQIFLQFTNLSFLVAFLVLKRSHLLLKHLLLLHLLACVTVTRYFQLLLTIISSLWKKCVAQWAVVTVMYLINKS